MFQREILKELNQWRNSQFRKPLILRGARQVGKTTIVKEFGKQFDNFLLFNLEIPSHRGIFENQLGLNEILELMFMMYGKQQMLGDTLIFIDEIQNSPHAIQLLRYFYEERPDLYVIAAGSLLENIVDIKISFPVGRVQYLALRPCSFREFLGAIGKTELLDIISNQHYASVLHNDLMFQFGKYMLVGGMPEAIEHYRKTNDIYSVDDVYETLLQAYSDDVEKYVTTNKLTEVVRFILRVGWGKVAETITLNEFAGSQYKAREVGEALRLLEKAMLTELVYPTSATQIPIIGEQKRKPKLIWLDTGMVNYVAKVRQQIIGASDVTDVWRGRIAEQVVAQELLTLDNKVSSKRAFWAKQTSNGAEVDFIREIDGKVYPIEVKSGINSHLRSLHSFIDSSNIDIAIRIWSQPFSVNNLQTISGKPFRLLNIPFYLVGNLENIIREYL